MLLAEETCVSKLQSHLEDRYRTLSAMIHMVP